MWHLTVVLLCRGMWISSVQCIWRVTVQLWLCTKHMTWQHWQCGGTAVADGEQDKTLLISCMYSTVCQLPVMMLSLEECVFLFEHVFHEQWYTEVKTRPRNSSQTVQSFISTHFNNWWASVVKQDLWQMHHVVASCQSSRQQTGWNVWQNAWQLF